MRMKRLTPQVLKRIIFEERQKIEEENRKNSILKELKLLMLLEKIMILCQTDLLIGLY